ncbi:hypothetical protein Tco_0975528 [Tanacetum coccineum]|uniref:Uncharacterized protein n=1 Tax=Tanacetum coccineum TaxID=301880 RepID=A0ABQ5EER8_9ASTR
MSKGNVKDKNRVFVVNVKHDGIFSPYPFSYIHGDEKQLTDFDFEEWNPNSWSRAFFDMNSKCASFENGIAESFNKAIVVQRTKPNITMLKDIRLYIMQRLVEMNKKAMNLEDRITPSIRKRLEILKEQQRYNAIKKGHNRRNCDKEQLPKPPQMKKQPGRKREPNFNSYASNKGGGRGSRGGRGGRGKGRGVTTMLVDEELSIHVKNASIL